MFHGLRQTERGLYRFYLPKFLLVGSLWFAAVTMAVLEETNELRDPSFSYQLNTAHYARFQARNSILRMAFQLPFNKKLYQQGLMSGYFVSLYLQKNECCSRKQSQLRDEI